MKLITYIALTALMACVLSQTLKLAFSTLLGKGKFRLRNITADGNYPSSHTGFVTSVTTISWISTIKSMVESREYSDVMIWCSMAFTALAVVIIRDALGVRYTVGKLCECVTKLADSSVDSEEIKKMLDVKSGHKPYEVVAGAIFGVIVASFTSCIYYGYIKFIPIVVLVFILYLAVSYFVLKAKKQKN